MEYDITAQQNKITDLIRLSCETQSLIKAVFSKPVSKGTKKASGTLLRRGKDIILQLEYSMNDGKVIHKNIEISDIAEKIAPDLQNFDQINLITSQGECEYRRTKNGGAVLLGADKLEKKLIGKPQGIKAEIPFHNREKQYILKGNEPFLITLGISDKNGRIHDKKQPKFRQINRFLEHIRDIEKHLPSSGELVIFDLCCGKSYLSFAAYYYFEHILGRQVIMTGVDLKEDVIAFCNETARELGFKNLEFICRNIADFSPKKKPHLVISLHACDTATDIVLSSASSLGANVILSTPCCQHELSTKLNCPSLSFIAEHSMLRRKLCDAATDALRLKKLESEGYSVCALELTDPDDTPKNILLRAIRRHDFDPASEAAAALRGEYKAALLFLTGYAE